MTQLRWLCAVAPMFAVACGGARAPSSERNADGGAAPPQPPLTAPTERDAAVPPGADEGTQPAAASVEAGVAEPPVSPSEGPGNDPNGVTPAGEPLPLVLDATPQHYQHVRLTHEQWENSVQDNLRLGEATGLLQGFALDQKVGKYSNNEVPLQVGPELVVDYAEAAATLARRVAEDPELLARVYAGTDAEGFVSEVGQRFYRRPLTTEELATLAELFSIGAALPDASDEFTGGASFVLEMLLQSPRFLYRIETGEVGQRLNGTELATKLAFALTNSTPSDDLLAQAAAGALDTDEGVRAAAEELLTTAHAVATLRRFHGETLGFEALLGITKEASLGYVEATNAELVEASYLFFDHIFEGSLGVRDVFLSDVGFAGDEMAALYGVQAPAGEGVRELTLGPERPGYFTQLPFLVFHSVGLTPHSIARGTTLNHAVLCAEVHVPPGDEQLLIAEGATNRQNVTETTRSVACADCHHQYLDPLGFAFENFDGLGRLRAEDNGLPVDTSGSYPFVEGQLSFEGAPELMQLLAESDQVHTCYASHLAEFGLAHELGRNEEGLVSALSTSSLQERAPLRELLLRLVTSSAFVTRGGSP